MCIRDSLYCVQAQVSRSGKGQMDDPGPQPSVLLVAVDNEADDWAHTQDWSVLGVLGMAGNAFPRMVRIEPEAHLPTGYVLGIALRWCSDTTSVKYVGAGTVVEMSLERIEAPDHEVHREMV